MANRLAVGLKVLLNGLVLNAFFCVISFYTVKYSAIWYLPLSIAVCMLLSIAGELSVKKVRRNFTAFLACVAVALFALGIGFLSFSYVNGSVFAIAVFVWLMLYRFNRNFFEIPFPHKSFILLFFLMYLIGVCFDIAIMKIFACAEGIVFLLVNTFMEGFVSHEKFIEENRNVRDFPQEQIRKTYLSLLAVFVCICLVVVVLITSIKLPQESLSNWVSDVLHNIYEILPKYDGSVGVAKPDVGMGGVDQYEEALIIFGIERKQYVWLEYVTNVIYLFLTVGVIFCFVYYFLKRIWGSLKQTKQIGADTVEFAYNDDKTEKVSRTDKKDAKDELNENKIRKIYRKYVLKTVGINVKKGDTPGMIQNKINANCEKSEIVRAIYEKARYSGQECDLKDVESIKRNVKK